MLIQLEAVEQGGANGSTRVYLSDVESYLTAIRRPANIRQSAQDIIDYRRPLEEERES